VREVCCRSFIKTLHSSFRLFFSLAVIGCLAVAIYEAGKLGLADLRSRQPIAAIRQWQTSKKLPSIYEWRIALNAMRTAHELDRENPAFTEEMGRLYDMSAGANLANDPGTIAYVQQGLAFFRSATQQRLTSSYTWANIALIKLKLGEIDQEFMHALELAAMLGPWEPEVQLAVANAGLAAWQRLPSHLQQVVAETVERAKLRQSVEVGKIVEKYKKP
jgi:hypothetical protein